MAVIKLGIGAVNITDYLIVVVRKVSDPTVEAARELYTPLQVASNLNVVIPSSGSLDPAEYYIDFRESADGTTLGALLKQMEFDATLQIPISETLYYKAGGTLPVDPAADQADLVDAYLNGKNITKVFKYGYGPLWPPGGARDPDKEYSLIAGGGIHLEGGQTFNFNERYSVEITYVSRFEQSTSNAGLYDGVLLISADTTLTSAHRNKRLKCESVSSRLVITLEDITTVPAGKFYQFNSNGGSQSKTRIRPQSGQLIRYQGEDRTEISIGQGESLRLEKYSTYWEVVNPPSGLSMVGERFIKAQVAVKNALAMDGSIVDGNDEPRLYYYVSHLSSVEAIIDDSLAVQPQGQEGRWVVSIAQFKLRLPNYQGYFQRALKSFSTFGADTSRYYDYPGGSAPEHVGDHKHWSIVAEDVGGGGGFPTAPLANTSPVRYFQKPGNESAYLVGSATTPSIGITSSPTSPGENTVKNIGEIYHVRT